MPYLKDFNNYSMEVNAKFFTERNPDELSTKINYIQKFPLKILGKLEDIIFSK